MLGTRSLKIRQDCGADGRWEFLGDTFFAVATFLHRSAVNARMGE
jgi:hypothetical protein